MIYNVANTINMGKPPWKAIDASGGEWTQILECDTETGRIEQYARDNRGWLVLNPVTGDLVVEVRMAPAPLQVIFQGGEPVTVACWQPGGYQASEEDWPTLPAGSRVVCVCVNADDEVLYLVATVGNALGSEPTAKSDDDEEWPIEFDFVVWWLVLPTPPDLGPLKYMD